MTEGIPDERLASGLSRERPVQRELEAREPMVVDARVAEYLRGDRVLRVEAAFLRIETEPRDVEALQPRRSRRIGLAFDVDEAVRPVGDSRVDLLRVQPEDARDDRRDLGRVAKAPPKSR